MLHKKPGSYITDIINDLEEKIVNLELENKKDILIEYIISKYGG